MARLKFIRRKEGCNEHQLVVESSQYEIIPRRNGSTDIRFIQNPGEAQTIEISHRPHGYCFSACYIESEMTGKTVEIIRARDRSIVTDKQVGNSYLSECPTLT